jgi:hypothetical protein
VGGIGGCSGRGGVLVLGSGVTRVCVWGVPLGCGGSESFGCCTCTLCIEPIFVMWLKEV